MMTFRKFFAIVLLSLMVLAACGSESGGGGVTLQTASDPADSSPTRRPETAPAGPDVLDEAGGALVFRRGSSLYLYPHPDTGEPVEINQHVDPNGIYITPDGRSIIFSLLEPDGFGASGVRRVDLQTLDQAMIAPEVTGRWEVVAISPDGQWLAIRNYAFGLAIVHLDGSAVYDEVAPSAAIPRWLSDGTVLVVHMDYTASGQPHYKSVVRFDPAAGQTADLEIDLEALDADPTLLDTALADMGLSYAETTDADPGPIYYAQEAEDDASPSPICERWQIVSILRDESGAAIDQLVVYEAPDTREIADLRVQADGSVLFTQWAVPDCDPVQTPVARLMRLVPGEDGAETMIEGLYAGAAIGEGYRRGTRTPRAALSPDGRYVAWISGNIDAGESALRLTDLTTGAESLILTADANSGDLNTFVETQLFTAVYWVTPG